MNAVRLLTIGLMLASAAPGVTASPERSGDIGPAKEKEATRGESLVEIIGARQDLTIFAKLIKTSGLEENLRKGGPFTILAPTDEAFDALSSDELEDLATNPTQIDDIIKRHILDELLSWDELKERTEVTTMSDETLTVEVDGDDVRVGGALVTPPEDDAVSGEPGQEVAVFGIDMVLLESS